MVEKYHLMFCFEIKHCLILLNLFMVQKFYIDLLFYKKSPLVELTLLKAIFQTKNKKT